MTTRSNPASPRAAGAPPREGSEAALKAATAWIHQFARTLKTCRLYDAGNPTVVRFREELGQALVRLVADHGPITYRFGSDDVLFEDASLYPARSRDDNPAFAFYRDGLRALTFGPGLLPRELDAVLDGVLRVTGQNLEEDDLVTLLWEANLPHVDIDYVPAEGGDPGTGTGQEPAEDGDGPLLPWPLALQTPNEETADSAAPGMEVSSEEVESSGRSDDWPIGDSTVEVEAAYVEIDALAETEVERFQREFAAEHAVSIPTSAVAIAHAWHAAQSLDEDRLELAHFLPRVLRSALAQGLWQEAAEALKLLLDGPATEWSFESFAQELLQPVSITSAAQKLDQQSAPVIADAVAFAGKLGDLAVDWLTLVLAESEQKRVRIVLAETLASMCRDNPERLAPYLSDPRWFVVRNVVHILGWIGGPAIVGLMQVALRHPEPRVRQEVIAALEHVDLKLSRQLLVRTLDGADTTSYCKILHLLSRSRDAATARYLFAEVQKESFVDRAPEERRAIYAALASTGGDEVVPELEAELHRGHWFARSMELHRTAIARCLARIGTPLSRAVLERGAHSKKQPIKRACEDALSGIQEPQ